MRYLKPDTTNPAMNLAVEEYVFDTLAREEDFFMLWQNHDAVIAGLHQNTAEEINLAYAEENGIEIVRRLSGGGAVFHDLGNINFTFISKREKNETDGTEFTQRISCALHTLGINTQLSGRNDMILDGCKISGTAGYFRDGRLMHHGTLLFDTNFEKMTEVLRVSGDKINSKGIASIRNRVRNLREYLPKMTTEEFKTRLSEIIASDMCEYKLTKHDIAAAEILSERYKSWDWNFGRSPGYSVVKSRRIPGFGMIRINMDTENGKITAFKTDGDYFGDKTCFDIASALTGTKLTYEAVIAVLSRFNLSEYYKGLSPAELTRLILM